MRKRILLLAFIPISLVAVVAVFLLATSERHSDTKQDIVTPSHEQKMWCLAGCAVLTQINEDRHDILGGVERTDENINNWMENLWEGWDVEDRETLLEALQWIDQGGHRQLFIETSFFLSSLSSQELEVLNNRVRRDPEAKNKIDIVREHYASLDEKNLVGWDYSRYLSLCGWAYVAGYLSEDDAWELMMPVARMLQDTFDSWEDLGANYLIGRSFWSLKHTQEGGVRFRKAYDWLCVDVNSPWVKIPWDLDLSLALSEGDDAANPTP